MDEPCAHVSAARKLLGVWARERRRQNVDLIDGELSDKAAMEAAVSAPVDELLQARCSCTCHESLETD